MKRYRLTSQRIGGTPHVSSVLLAEDEVEEQLEAEALLHRMSGWVVTEGDRTLVCRRGTLVRVIGVRESDPMHDTLE